MSGKLRLTPGYHARVNDVQAPWPAAAGPFDRPDWFALLADEASDPLVATVHADGGSLVAAAGLQRTPTGLAALTNWFAFTWRPLLAEGPLGDRALRALARSLRGRAARLTFEKLPNEDRSASRTAAALREAGWIVFAAPCDRNHVLPVGGRSFDAYWSSRPGRMRTTLQRKSKKVDVAVLTRFDAEIWQAYEAIYAASWKPDERDAALLRRFAEAEGAAGRIRLAIARADGTPVAAQFWTVDGATAYIHKLAHLEEHRKLSAGTTLTAALMRHVIEEDRVELVDFGTGDDPYKRDWMERVRLRWRIDAYDPRSPAAWPALARAGARAVCAPGWRWLGPRAGNGRAPDG